MKRLTLSRDWQVCDTVYDTQCKTVEDEKCEIRYEDKCEQKYEVSPASHYVRGNVRVLPTFHQEIFRTFELLKYKIDYAENNFSGKLN